LEAGRLSGEAKVKEIIALGIFFGVSLAGDNGIGDNGAASTKLAKPYPPVFASVYAPAAERSVEPYRMRGGLINRTGLAIDGVPPMEISSGSKKNLQDGGITLSRSPDLAGAGR
jgi:hypothetical protein